MTRPSLSALFDPRSVAVIGASRDPSKVGGSVLANLHSAGFQGRVIPINARADRVQGLAAVASMLDVAGPIDLAVITVPAAAVLPALKDCVAKGVPAAVVISAGFREGGAEGHERERELRAWLDQNPVGFGGIYVEVLKDTSDLILVVFSFPRGVLGTIRARLSRPAS